jgi:hypothetical protein
MSWFCWNTGGALVFGAIAFTTIATPPTNPLPLGKDGHYRVRLDTNWYDVPDDAVIGEPNRAGKTMVWPYYSNGKLLYIRCFMPGDMG